MPVKKAAAQSTRPSSFTGATRRNQGRPESTRAEGAKKKKPSAPKTGPQVTKTSAGTFVDLGDIESVFGGIMDVLGYNQSEASNALNRQADFAELTEQTRSNEEIAGLNLQGVKSQSEATKYASEQSAGATRYASEQAAGATRFAATESARGQIETQRVASESAERQIGLSGEQERLGIAATGEQQRKTQSELLAGQERQIGLTGEQERLTAVTRGEQERLGIGETGRQQRETELQQELYRRYREEKDYSQARGAFRA